MLSTKAGRVGEGEWTVVQRKKRLMRKGKLDMALSSDHVEKEGEVTYFFTNIPDNFLAKDMYQVFEKYGRIVKVIIPAKRDKLGKRFGFARFVDVREVDFFAIQLDNIIIGNTKIFANSPRFDRGLKGSKVAPRTDPPMKQCNAASKGWHQNLRSHGRSYAEAVNIKRDGGNQMPRKQVVQRFKRKVNNANLEFKIANETVMAMGNAYVGVVSTPGSAYCIPDEFIRQGYFTIKVTPMGANLVLLESSEGGDISSLLTDGREWLLKWFDSIRPWHPRDIDNERLTSLIIFGELFLLGLACRGFGIMA